MNFHADFMQVECHYDGGASGTLPHIYISPHLLNRGVVFLLLS